MDEINAFFDFSKIVKREPKREECATSSGGGTAAPPRPVKREYFENYASEEHHRLKRVVMPTKEEPQPSVVEPTGMDDLELLSEDEENHIYKTEKGKQDPVYAKYCFDVKAEEHLPIYDAKDKILSLIRNKHVVILEGETGCGKTTQVPQYLLNDAYRRREYCNIVCTQPRRIAAISIANRVCQECKWEIGTVCGYQVGLHAEASDDTRLLYCTTGVLLQKLIKQKTLTPYTHIILDEVHEREKDMDFLLIVIRRLLTTNSRNVKIVLMSATIDTTIFAEYFKIRNEPAQVLKVDTRRLYEIREFYLDNLGAINSMGVMVDYEKPGISQDMYKLTLKVIHVIDNLERQEVQSNVAEEASIDQLNRMAILVFLPGINEIDNLYRKLISLNESNESTAQMFPIRLHSMIAQEEQTKIFQRAPSGFRKVILATNIAESSITVPDVKYVIDFCLTKTLLTDTSTNFTSLTLHWAAKANCRQRAGRAGRLQHGRVYRMVTKYFFKNFLDEYTVPEMLRCPLENIILKAKLLEMGPPPKILGLALTPPNLSDIHNTILTLKEQGALYTFLNGTYTLQDGDITFMGRVMAALPLDLRLSRLIVLGHVFSALEDAIIIAAGLSMKTIFTLNSDRFQSEVNAHLQKLVWADGSNSDLFAILKAYKVWTTMREQHNIHGENGELGWARRYSINLRSMKEMHLLILELKERLLAFGITEKKPYARALWIDSEKTIILKIIIAGAFYPNYFVRSTLNDLSYERDVFHMLEGNDPCSTVFFTKLDTRHIGQLYTRSIKNIFKDLHIPPENMEVRFSTGSERVFVLFKSDPAEEDDPETDSVLAKIPGCTRQEIYKAVRLRLLGVRTSIPVMEHTAEVEYATKKGYGALRECVWHHRKTVVVNPELWVLPSLFDNRLRGYITHINDCSRFYFQPLSEMERLREIHVLLNDPEEIARCRFQTPGDVAKGMLLGARFEGNFHRAKVLKAVPSSRQHVRFKVYFLDYGNTLTLDFEELRPLSYKGQSLRDLPPRMFECRLAAVRPSLVKCPNGRWSDQAMELMQKLADSGIVEIEVYSVVEDKVNVVVKMENGTLNDLLVERSLARVTDESLMSKLDHDNRKRRQMFPERFTSEEREKQSEEYVRFFKPDVDVEVDPPPRELCTKKITLGGPFSPLETNFYSAMHAAAWKQMNIERESVNAALIDSHPLDVHERLLVAASVTESHNNQKLTARATTMMPNIRGFGALMTLLFCPRAQIKTNREHTKYSSILVGLGYDPRQQPENGRCPSLFEEHDITLTLDVELQLEDFEIINQIRYSMDSILFTAPDDDRPSVTAAVRGDLAAKIKTLVIRLLSKNRKYIESNTDAGDSKWCLYDRKSLYSTENIYGKRSIFPMHMPPRLKDEDRQDLQALTKNCDELHHIKQFSRAQNPIVCDLCKQTLDSVAQLRIHLLSQLHRNREEHIRYFPPN